MAHRFLSSQNRKRSRIDMQFSGSGIHNIRRSIQTFASATSSSSFVSSHQNIICHLPNTNCLVHATHGSTNRTFENIQLLQLSCSKSSADLRIFKGKYHIIGIPIHQLRSSKWSNKSSIVLRSTSECRVYNVDNTNNRDYTKENECIPKLSSEYASFKTNEHSKTSYLTPSPHMPEMLVVRDTGLLTLWDINTSQIIQSYNKTQDNNNNNNNNNNGDNTTYLAEYTGHPRCAWCVGRKSQLVQLLDMRSSTKAIKMQCIGSGSKTLEGMGGQAQPITSLHRTETAPFQCVVGSTNRILIFDTRYTSVPIHMWRHPHIGNIDVLHSHSLLEESQQEENNQINMFVATSYDKCTSSCIVHQSRDDKNATSSVHSGASTFNQPHIVEHWRRMDTNGGAPTRLAGVDLVSKKDIVHDENDYDDESNGESNGESNDDDESNNESNSDSNDDNGDMMHRSAKKGTLFISHITRNGSVGIRAVTWGKNNPKLFIDIVRQKRACGDTHTADTATGNNASSKRKRSTIHGNHDEMIELSTTAKKKNKNIGPKILKYHGPKTFQELKDSNFKYDGPSVPFSSTGFSSASAVSSDSSALSSSASSSSSLGSIRHNTIPGNFTRPRQSRETMFENTRHHQIESISESIFGSSISRIPTLFPEALPESNARQIVSINHWKYQNNTSQKGTRGTRGKRSRRRNANNTANSANNESDEEEDEDDNEEDDEGGSSWLNNDAANVIPIADMKNKW